jgi:signal transduction histidine kinase
MFERRSLRWPITLGVVMIVLLVALTVGWIMLALSGALQDRGFAPLYWTMLTIGTTFLVLVLVGVIFYLALSVKAINLNRRQSNFIDSVTHELKSPIASLKLYLQTLNRRQVSPAEQQDFFRFMLEDVERLDQLISHLLDAARLERPPTKEELEWVDLDLLLQRCSEELQLRHGVPGTRVQVRAAPIVIQARRADLEMILRNLIDNALKYGGDSPHVEVDATLDETNLVHLRVSDNGPGVPPRERRKIFGRFVRLGEELERHKPGTGLGLYIVQTLVRRLRGQIRVVDRADGQGSVFEVLLPGRAATAEDRTPSAPQRTQAEVA